MEGREGHLRAQNASHSLAFSFPSALPLFAVHTLKKIYMRMYSQLQEGKHSKLTL